LNPKDGGFEEVVSDENLRRVVEEIEKIRKIRR